MKRHYDFSKASQGKKYRPADKLLTAAYLDRDLERGLAATGKGARDNLSQIVNSILREELEVAELLQDR